jgi:hypothetical protein
VFNSISSTEKIDIFDREMIMRKIKATKEQQVVAKSSARVKVIEAYAGCGKSWVLHQEALAYPKEHILYLVYGKRARKEAERLFADCPRVDVRTIHSHAYRSGQWETSEYALSPYTIYRYLEGKTIQEDQHEVAWVICAFLNKYLNIPTRDLEEAFVDYCHEESGEIATILVRYKEIILDISAELLKGWLEKKSPCPHDFYLKYSYLVGSFQNGLTRYNRILIDEAQDLSPIMFACLDGCKQSVVIAGDSHQSIYSFRHALNALAHVKADEEFTLSKSFRFGPEIAQFVTEYMQTCVDKNFVIRGNSKIASGVYLEGSSYHQRDYIVLARTNFDLITRSVKYLKEDNPFYFEKDITYIFNKLEDLWHLENGRLRQIKDEFLKTFSSLAQVKRYAISIEDVLLMNLITIIDVYHDNFSELLYNLKECVGIDRGTNHGIALSTVHTSKGQEYDHVCISHDLYRNLERAIARGDYISEEFRIFYVAITRARKTLILPREFEEIYTKGWRAWKDKYIVPVQTSFWKSDDDQVSISE